MIWNLHFCSTFVLNNYEQQSFFISFSFLISLSIYLWYKGRPQCIRLPLKAGYEILSLKLYLFYFPNICGINWNLEFVPQIAPLLLNSYRSLFTERRCSTTYSSFTFSPFARQRWRHKAYGFFRWCIPCYSYNSTSGWG